MLTVYTYLKNSNTGELMMSQEFTESTIKSIPIFFYDVNGGKIGENLDTAGFVTISKKKWDRYMRKGVDITTDCSI